MAEDLQEAGHETSDIQAPLVGWFGLGLLVSIVVIGVLVAWMDKKLSHTSHPWPRQPVVERPQHEAASPIIGATPVEDYQRHMAEEDKVLHGTGWVERKQGVIHIPVDRARELVLQRGLPATGTTMPLPGPQPKPPAGGTTP